MIIYHIGEDGYWNGEIRHLDSKGGAPSGWTRTTPPECADGTYPRWLGGWICSLIDPEVNIDAHTTWLAERSIEREAVLIKLGITNDEAAILLRGQE